VSEEEKREKEKRREKNLQNEPIPHPSVIQEKKSPPSPKKEKIGHQK